MDDAVRKLCKYFNNGRSRGNSLCLLADPELSIYLIPFVRRNGHLAYDVSDGLPGVRGHANTYSDLDEAIKGFCEVQDAGGWKTWAETKQAQCDEMVAFKRRR